MGRTPNFTHAGMYSRLVGLYPEPYRRQYGQPMVQTFDDMLEAEPSKLRRALIWARALVDLPGSALKEHLTNGRGITMNRNTKIILIAAALALIFANGISFWFGILHARQSTTIQKVTATQLADAMQGDEFYSKYGNSALLFSAKVVAAHQYGDKTVATFQTSHTYVLQCQFSSSTQLKSNDVVTVAAPGGSAERQSHGVLLRDCVKN